MNEVQKGADLRAFADGLQEYMQTLPQVECPVRHFFAPGVYMREMTIPKGVAAIGAAHKHEHLSILSKGVLRLTTEEGIVELTAPVTLHSKPGIKRVAFAVEEAVFTTIHHNPSNTQDMDALALEHVDVPAPMLMGGPANVQMLNNKAVEVLP